MKGTLQKINITEIERNILGKQPTMCGTGWKLNIVLRRNAVMALTKQDLNEIKKGIIAHIEEGTMQLDDIFANHKWELELEKGYSL